MPRPKLPPEERLARKKANALRYYYKKHEENKTKGLARYHANLAAMTPDELDAFRAQQNEKNHLLRANPTPEQLESKRESGRRYHHTHRDTLLPKMSARYHAKMESMTQEGLETHRAQKNEAQKRFYTNHTAEISAKKTSPMTRQKEAEQARARRAANPEPRLAYESVYRANHREAETAKSLAWARRNPEKVNTIVERRRARIRNAPINDVTPEQRKLVLAIAKGRCVYCPHYNPGCKLCRRGAHKGLTVDHISPVGPTGPNTLQNLVAACRSCNSKKRTKPNPVPVQPLLHDFDYHDEDIANLHATTEDVYAPKVVIPDTQLPLL